MEAERIDFKRKINIEKRKMMQSQEGTTKDKDDYDKKKSILLDEMMTKDEQISKLAKQLIDTRKELHQRSNFILFILDTSSGNITCVCSGQDASFVSAIQGQGQIYSSNASKIMNQSSSFTNLSRISSNRPNSVMEVTKKGSNKRYAPLGANKSMLQGNISGQGGTSNLQGYNTNPVGISGKNSPTRNKSISTVRRSASLKMPQVPTSDHTKHYEGALIVKKESFEKVSKRELRLLKLYVVALNL